MGTKQGHMYIYCALGGVYMIRFARFCAKASENVRGARVQLHVTISYRLLKVSHKQQNVECLYMPVSVSMHIICAHMHLTYYMQMCTLTHHTHAHL